MVVAVIADIVGSRRLRDRAGAQRVFDETIVRVQREHPLADQPLQPTVGDEQQGVYRTLDDALAGVLLLQLALPEGIEFRYGLGIGEIRAIESAHRELTDGPGWWAAREAIDTVHARQERAVPTARSWIVAAPGQDEVMESQVSTSNAYLLARDAIVVRMTERERRLTYGRIGGLSQSALAEQEGITQPAVSKALRSSGAAALLDGLALMTGERS
ncbi:SatD family protein [Microbacterium esteraromaticum]|uniref:SatD family protein n=1 Tax=Microbacterium esteraromaticum TaxID=57043 RepID=UPI00195744B3|nr:SatD family protein [Microbacterium esteraromaticum]MBM7464939.1 DNA-binding CsgD family transcriptional regulator [Microbacterium esteraromaticum]